MRWGEERALSDLDNVEEDVGEALAAALHALVPWERRGRAQDRAWRSASEGSACGSGGESRGYRRRE